MRFDRFPRPQVAAAAAIHLLTATGAVLGLAALHLAAAGRFSAAFAMLGLALLVDGIDGPLARRYAIDRALPRFSGVRLDLVVDYVTYCVAPAFILWQGGLLPPVLAGIAAAAIVLSSLFHFADRESKTPDGWFVGFPALWNIAVFYLFAMGLSGLPVAAIVGALAAATFVPLTWPHPLRVARLRPLTLAIVALSGVAAFATLIHGFPAPGWAQAVMTAAVLYLLALTVWRSLRGISDKSAG